MDWQLFADRPMWIVGFSDATVLHVEAARVHVASIHGPNLSSLGRADDRSRREFLSVLENPRQRRTYAPLQVLRPGAAEGPSLAGISQCFMPVPLRGGYTCRWGACCCLRMSPSGRTGSTESQYPRDRRASLQGGGGRSRRASASAIPAPMARRSSTCSRTTSSVSGSRSCPGCPWGTGLENDPVVLGATAKLEARARGGELIRQGKIEGAFNTPVAAVG